MTKFVLEYHEQCVGQLDDLGHPVDKVDLLEQWVWFFVIQTVRSPEAVNETKKTNDIDEADCNVVDKQDLQNNFITFIF